MSHLALRNISRHKLRNALTALAICVAIALVVGLNSAFDSAHIQVQETLSVASGAIDILVRPRDTNSTIDDSVVKGIGKLDGVAAAAGRIGEDSGVWKGGKKYKGHVIGVSEDDFNYNDSTFTKISGTRVLGSYGIVIDERMGLEIGTSLTIRGYAFEVVGLFTPTVTSDVTVSADEYYYVFISLSRAQAIFDKSGSVDYALVKVTNLGKLGDTAKRIREKYTSLIVFEVKKAAAEQAAQFTSSFHRSLQFMAFVAFLLGSFICFNTAYLNVIERKSEVGLLRAVGASRLDIFLMFLEETILIALIGATAGLLLGLGLTLGFNYFLSDLYKTSLSLPLPDEEMLTLVAELGLGSALLGGLIPSIDASRVDVIKAIQHKTSPSGSPKRRKLLIFVTGVCLILAGQYVAPLYSVYHVGNIDVFSLSLVTTGAVLVTASLLEYISRILRIFTFILVGRLSELPIKNIARNAGKSILCLILVTVCLTFIIAIGGMESTVTGSITGAAGGFFTSDLILYSNTGFPTDFPDDLASEYGEIDEVAGVRVISEDVYNMNREIARLGNSSIYSQILTVDPELFFSLVEMSMSADTPGYPVGLLEEDKTCFISRTLAQNIHLDIGDDLGIKTTDWRLAEGLDLEELDLDDTSTYSEVQEVHKLKIVGIVDDPNLGFLWFGGRPFDEIVVTSYDSMESLYEKTIDPPDLDISNLAFIKVASGYTGQIQSLKDSILGKYGEDYDLNIFTREDLISMVRGNIDDIFNLFYLCVGFSLVVAAIGMANVMTISVSERGWEVYVLRALGASRRQASLSFYAETFALSMIGLMVGLANGLLFWSRVSSVFLSRGGSILSILPLRAIEWSIYAVIAVTVIGGSYPAWRASQILPVGKIIGGRRKKRKVKARSTPRKLGSLGLKEDRTSLEEIKGQIRKDLRLSHPPTITRVPVPESSLVEKKREVESSKVRISPRLVKRLQNVGDESGLLSFLVPDNLTPEISESILQWLPKRTKIVETTTVQARENSGKLVNSVFILCYSPISNEIGDFLTKVPKGSFRVVLVPLSTFERLPKDSQSRIQWRLGTRTSE